MQLTESQSTALATIASHLDGGHDGHEFLREVMALQREGVNVYEALEEHHGIILNEDEDTTGGTE